MKLKPWLQWRGQELAGKLLSRLLWPPSTVTGILVEDESVLALDTGGYLMLPGGTVKKGEDFEEAVRREVKEETGLEVEVTGELEDGLNEVGGVEKVFLVERKAYEKEFLDNWEGEPRWIPVEEVPRHRWRFDRDVERLLQAAQDK